MSEVRIEWRDKEKPWAEHEVLWPADVRVPVTGDYICVYGQGSDCRKVTAVLFDPDGSAVVRLEYHPR
jgi:hypothetical protein